MGKLDPKRDLLRRVLSQWGRPTRELTVERIMTQRPTCVDVNATALEMVKLSYSLRFRHLLVVDANGTLVGLISDRDLCRCFGVGDQVDEDQLARIDVQTLMSRDLITVPRDALVVDAVRTMLGQGIHCLPVVEAGRPVGILTGSDCYLLLEELLQVDSPVDPALAALSDRS